MNQIIFSIPWGVEIAEGGGKSVVVQVREGVGPLASLVAELPPYPLVLYTVHSVLWVKYRPLFVATSWPGRATSWLKG